MSVLVCGGAGYIGSHTVHQLLERDTDVIVIDNLSTGHTEAIKNVKFYQGDIRNKEILDKVFTENKINSVVHFAADALVVESMKNPLKYFNNNVYGMQVLLEAMVKHGTDKIVFSSTCATYGEPKTLPIFEKNETNPINPYGESKLIMEKMMRWVDEIHHIKYVSLRYFNAAGAIEDGSIGEDHKYETHLIPLVLQVPLGQRKYVNIFGNDYNTKDGTCIRDYIHVMDLADAHILALDYLRNGNESNVFNLGNGNGFSVKEIILAAQKVTCKEIKIKMSERRPGDPPELVASNEKAKNILKWNPKYTNIEHIIETAWRWHSKHPNGY